MTRLSLLAALLLCSACGKREEPAAPASRQAPPQTAAAPRADDRPVIACFGDSLTAGLGLDPGQTYPDVLQQHIDTQHLRYRVVNMGISGDTSQDGLARLSLVVAEKPSLVVLELGANDGLRGQPIAVTTSNLSLIIEALQKENVRIILAGITLPPNYGPDYIRRFEAMYHGLASKYRLPLIPFLLEGVGGNARLMQRDGLHPTAEGARIVADTVWKKIQLML